MRGKLLCLGLLMCCCFHPALVAQDQPKVTGALSPPEVQRVQAEAAKLQAETNKLNAEAAYYRNLPRNSAIQYFVGIAAIVIPLLLGVKQLSEQRRSLMERARVDASLKAAEIAMNASSTGLVKARATILGEMLKEFVPDFGRQIAGIDHNKVGLGSWRERFLRLLDAIASDPEHAALIARSYTHLFPDDDEAARKKVNALIRYLESSTIDWTGNASDDSEER